MSGIGRRLFIRRSGVAAATHTQALQDTFSELPAISISGMQASCIIKRQLRLVTAMEDRDGELSPQGVHSRGVPQNSLISGALAQLRVSEETHKVLLVTSTIIEVQNIIIGSRK